VPFRSWLYRIATNLASSAFRRRRWRILLLGDAGAAAAGAAKGAQSEPQRNEDARQRAREALASLGAADQAILVLRFVEGLSIEEVAAILRCPPGTVQSKTARARERLRRRLDRRTQR
jgi:RNA polymerase sigma factor (sigma-70 family)